MNKISAVILAKNEEELIADCIESVKFCNEIIVIDNGSTDRTAEVAKHFGARVIPFKSDDFSILRNAGLRAAKGKWVLYIDADERVSENLKANIISSMEEKDLVPCFLFQRKNYYLGASEKNAWPYIEKIERLFEKNKLKKWQGKLHESPVVEGGKKTLDGFLLHYTHRNLSLMLNKTLEWSKIEAELRYKSNHPTMTLWRFPRVMVAAFYNSFVTQRGYSVGTIGLIESLYQSYSMFLTYARLWELQNGIKEKNNKR